MYFISKNGDLSGRMIFFPPVVFRQPLNTSASTLASRTYGKLLLSCNTIDDHTEFSKPPTKYLSVIIFIPV